MYKDKGFMQVKQGDTFNVLACFTEDDKTPINIDGMMIKASIKDSSETLITSMDIHILNAENGLFEVALPNGFMLPCKTLFLDIKLIEGDVLRTGDIVRIDVQKVVTDG